MGSLVQCKGDDCPRRFALIKERCSLQVKAGLVLGYDKDKRVITHTENNSEKAEIIVAIENSNNNMRVIVPFFIARNVLGVKKLSIYLENPVPLSFNGALRVHQEGDSSAIITSLDTKGYCYFKAYPGYGKTVIIAYILSYFKQKAIIVVPNLTLVTQTFNSLRQTLPDAKIAILGTDRIIPDGTEIVISYRGRLNGPAVNLEAFDFLVLDEVHMLSTAIGIAGMLTCRPTKILAVTATGGERNNITELFAGPCEIESLSEKTWYIAFPRVYSGLNSDDYVGVNGYTDAMTSLTRCPLYVQSIINMVRYFYKRNKRTILITMRTELRDKFVEMLKEETPETKNRPPIVVDYLGPEKPKCSNADVIVGTHKFIGTGFDLSNSIDGFDGKSASVVVFCGSIKDKTLMYQNAGRSFRSRDSLAIFPCIEDLSVSRNHTNMLRKETKEMEGCIILNRYSEFLEQFTMLPTL